MVASLDMGPVRRTVRRARSVILLGAGLAVAATLTAMPLARGATSSSVVGATVLSATSLSVGGCAGNAANKTSFGAMPAGSTSVLSQDCAVQFGSSNDTSMLRMGQSDFTGTALAQLPSGTLDPTFSTDGKLSTSLGSSYTTAYAMAVQPDGMVVAVGGAGNPALDFGVTRYEADGDPDPTFGTGGSRTTDFSGGTDEATAVVVQPDGKVVVGGRASNGTWDFALVRYNADGSLDPSFGTGGKVTTAIGAGADQLWGLALQPDGKVVAVGYSAGATWDFAVVRYNADGSLDTGFGTGGKVTTPIGAGSENALAVVLQPDGKIVAGGWSSGDFALVRYNPDGSLDTGFGTSGKVTTSLGPGNDIASGLALQPDGRLILAGSAFLSGANDSALARYNADGSLDATFGAGGIRITNAGGDDWFNGVAVQSDGRVVAAGKARIGAADDVLVARYGAAGSVDTTFGSGTGIVTTSVGVGDEASALAIAPNGKIVAAGTENAGGGIYNQILVRYGTGATIADWAGSWAAPSAFGACLHTVGGGATSVWTLAGTGNCTTALPANWNRVPTTSTKIATAASGTTAAVANLRFGVKMGATQTPGSYQAGVLFEVVAPAT